jgi:hypothetical protein
VDQRLFALRRGSSRCSNDALRQPHTDRCGRRTHQTRTETATSAKLIGRFALWGRCHVAIHSCVKLPQSFAALILRAALSARRRNGCPVSLVRAISLLQLRQLTSALSGTRLAFSLKNTSASWAPEFHPVIHGNIPCEMGQCCLTETTKYRSGVGRLALLCEE